MPLETGTRLGPYEILAPLGAGSMGEVYRARDTKLEREVAIKVLPEHFARDEDSRMRFDREVRAVAALSHPNILAIYELEQEGDRSYAVTELLEGATLRSRIGVDPLPTRKAVDYARQTAHGLAAAHDKGIVHRDIKPENVFVTHDGRVKILDFGLARFESPLEAGTDSSSPTADPATRKGAVLGSVGYMSPEQARGADADGRADIFSLGAVLYEMLTGARAFQRDSTADMLSAILRDEPPPPSEKNPRVPKALDLIVLHCLEKSPDERFQSARDLAFHLDSLGDSASRGSVELPPIQRRGRARKLGAAMVAILLAAGVFEVGRRVGRTSGAANDVDAAALPAIFRQLTDLPGEERDAQLGPGGRTFVFVSDAAGNPDVYLQRVSGRNPLNLTADSPAADRGPAFSPDGEKIAFRSERDGGGIFVMGSTGESVRRLTDFGHDPAWAPSGDRIVFSTEAGRDPWLRSGIGRLHVVDLPTGDWEALGDGTADAVQPSWSPHGHRIAYWGFHTGGQRDLWTVPADGSEAAPVAVTDDAAFDWSPAWSPDGAHLYFASERGGTMNLWRVAIDEVTGRLLGEPQPVTTPSQTSGEISLSADGTLMAFVSWDRRSSLQRVGFDPVSGSVSAPPDTVFQGARVIAHQALSPDGEWIAFTTRGVQEDLFLVRADGSQLRQLTDDEFRDRGPDWSPDGERIAFYSDRSGNYEAWAIRSDGRDLEQLATTDRRTQWYPHWSPDGTRLATADAEGTYITDLTVPLVERSTVALPKTEEGLPLLPRSWSPDGRLLAGELQPVERGPTYIYSFDSESYTRVGDARGVPAWLSDGRRLLVAQPDQIVLVDTLTGEMRTVLARSAAGLSVSEDGRWFSFLDHSVEADVWLAELR